MKSELAEWLADFVRSVSRSKRNFVSPPSEDWIEEGFMYLGGTFGYDAILRVNEEIWVFEYDLIRNDDPGTWHLASGNERLSALVMAARHYPELARLLPEKTDASRPCELCNDTGLFYHIMDCPQCGGLGWILDGMQPD